MGERLKGPRPWGGFALSTLFHALLILLVLGVFKRSEEHDQSKENRQLVKVPKPEDVQLVYVAPPPKPTPTPVQPPPERALPKNFKEPARNDASTQVKPNPASTPATQPDQVAKPSGAQPGEANDPLNTAARERGTAQPPEAPKEAPNAPPTSTPTAPMPAAGKPEVRAPTLEDEARRLFGSNRRTPSGRPERAYGGAEIPWHAGNGQCEQVPEHPDSVIVMGFVAGQVIGSDNGKPLAGAYLQILGTPYSTYSDNGGFYKLSFDLSLVANCRTQAVRVTAPGYSAADLLLGVGVGNNTVPLRR
jgi:hypothetical protein